MPKPDCFISSAVPHLIVHGAVLRGHIELGPHHRDAVPLHVLVVSTALSYLGHSCATSSPTVSCAFSLSRVNIVDELRPNRATSALSISPKPATPPFISAEQLGARLHLSMNRRARGPHTVCGVALASAW